MTDRGDTSVTQRGASRPRPAPAPPPAAPLSRDGRAGPPASAAARQPVFATIAEALAGEIARGRPQPGERLPSEAALAERFGVNRHTLRRALAELAARGLVRTSVGRGSFVEAPPLAYAIGRRTRFSDNVEGAGLEPGSELLEAIEVPADAEVAAALGLEPGAATLRLRTRRTADGVPLTLNTAHLPLPRFANAARAYEERGSMTAALRACGVEAYARAWTRISARTAAREEAAALDLAPGRVVLVVDKLDVDGEGRPVTVSYGVFAADRVSFAVGGDGADAALGHEADG